jgi:hypothetical protein
MVRVRLLAYIHLFLLVCAVVQGAAQAQDVSAPAPQPGTIVGTAMDTNGGTIPNASVVVQGIAPGDRYTAQTNGLKICRGQPHVGSSPTSATIPTAQPEEHFRHN